MNISPGIYVENADSSVPLGEWIADQVEGQQEPPPGPQPSAPPSTAPAPAPSPAQGPPEGAMSGVTVSLEDDSRMFAVVVGVYGFVEVHTSLSMLCNTLGPSLYVKQLCISCNVSITICGEKNCTTGKVCVVDAGIIQV